MAVELAAISLETTETGKATFILNATRKDLEAAPSFKNAEQQVTEKRLDELAKEQRENNTLTQGFTPPANQQEQQQ